MAVLCIAWLIAFTTIVASEKQMAIIFPDEVPVPIRAKSVASQVGVSSPEVPFSCKYTYNFPVRTSIEKRIEGPLFPYYLNATAEKLRSEGFEVTVTKMEGDEIKAISYTNGTFAEKISLKNGGGGFGVGGKPATRDKAPAVALIGYRKGSQTNWFCDGVLINRNWVLSAAHCLLTTNLKANVIRLGEYNLSTDEDHGWKQTPFFDQTLDYNIEKIVPHPEFELNKRYHDLVLFKLERSIPELSIRIQPLCLPWGNPESDYSVNQRLDGSNVTLLGWGATSFGRMNEPADILQEVDLEVFDTQKCHKAYEQLQFFKTKYPKGMSNEEILCVGSQEGGKDACQGDSGGPLVYQKAELKNKLILVGIVSGGYGCGLKEFPGIYIPIHKPKYLQWIKDVAFEEYLPSNLNKRLWYNYAQRFTNIILKVYYEQKQLQINENWTNTTISLMSIAIESLKQSPANEKIEQVLNIFLLDLSNILEKFKNEYSEKYLTSELEEKLKNRILSAVGNIPENFKNAILPSVVNLS